MNLLKDSTNTEEICDQMALCAPNLTLLLRNRNLGISAQELSECTLGTEYVCSQGKRLIETCNVSIYIYLRI